MKPTKSLALLLHHPLLMESAQLTREALTLMIHRIRNEAFLEAHASEGCEWSQRNGEGSENAGPKQDSEQRAPPKQAGVHF